MMGRDEVKTLTMLLSWLFFFFSSLFVSSASKGGETWHWGKIFG